MRIRMEDVRRRVRRAFGMDDVCDLYPFDELDYHGFLGIDPSVPLGNMSFCSPSVPGWDGFRLVSVRQFNYRLPYGLKKGETPGWLGGFLEKRAYFFIVTDKDFRPVAKIDAEIPKLAYLEDIRLAGGADGVIFASATDVSAGNRSHVMCAMRIAISGGPLSGRCRLVTDGKMTVFPTQREKNYMPVVGSDLDTGDIMYVTDMVVNGYRAATLSMPEKRLFLCEGMRQMRGSSQIVPCDGPYGEGYVCVAHRKTREGRYVNALVFMDKRMKSASYSREFTVMGPETPVNFICGMSVEDGKAVLPFCVSDRRTLLFRIPIADFAPEKA